MDIDHLLKQQSIWIDRARDTALQITRSGAGTTPEEAGLEGTQERSEQEDRIRTLEARRKATIKVFDAAIEIERRSLAELPSSEPAPAKRRAAEPAARKRKGRGKPSA